MEKQKRYRRKAAQQIYKFLYGMGAPVDIIVETPEKTLKSNTPTNLATTTLAPFAPPGTAAQTILHPTAISIYHILRRMRQTPQPQKITPSFPGHTR